MVATFRWLKGHGTENDFLLLPDHEGSAHGELRPELVRELCHRRRGIGADGVLRVVRCSASDDPAAAAAADAGAEWFMDYHNADGSRSQMCGNGIRVFARYLESAGLVDPAEPAVIGTRDGAKVVLWADNGRLSVDMGVGAVGGEVKIGVGGRSWPAVHVDTGNPHAVVFVEALADAGPLLASPEYDPADFPDGVNIEFAVLTGEAAVAMRVFERGVGETCSCGTGACAVALAVAGGRPGEVTVTTPGGALAVDVGSDGRMELTGPAVLVAEGTYPFG